MAAKNYDTLSEQTTLHTETIMILRRLVTILKTISYKVETSFGTYLPIKLTFNFIFSSEEDIHVVHAVLEPHRSNLALYRLLLCNYCPNV